MDDIVPKRRPRRERAPTNSDPVDIAMEAAASADPPGVALGLLADHRRLVGWQIAGERASVALKLLTGLAGLAVAVALSAMAWDAHNENGLVIQAFSVPPDLAAKGITGKVVASRLLDNLTAMQAATASSRAASTYANTWSGDIKVEIPETGVSIGEIRRTLVQWLGHQTIVDGEVFRTPTGLALAARVGAIPAKTQAGSEAELDALIHTAAERVFEDTQPYRYYVYVRSTDDGRRYEEARAVLGRLIAAGVPEDQPWAQIGLSRDAPDEAGRLQILKRLADLNPNLAALWDNAVTTQRSLGHDEQARAYSLNLIAATSRRDRGGVSEGAAVGMPLTARADFAALSGDYGTAAAMLRKLAITGDNDNGRRATAPLVRAAMLAKLHDVAAARALIPPDQADAMLGRTLRNTQFAIFPPQATIARAQEDWAGVYRQLADLEAVWPAFVARINMRAAANDPVMRYWPGMAEALAHMDRMDEAKALIGRTPLDCYPCVRMRGVIAALAGEPRLADHWFGEAVKMGPGMPFADFEWARALLDRGDAAGAIVRLTAAHQKGPRFADPLELWGEALLNQGDAKASAAKFAEAGRLAPNWGRLHLKWGQALARLGDAAGANGQFATAAKLDLTPIERAELAKVFQ